MALLKFGSIIVSGSGSLAGHTIQHSHGGMQLRSKPHIQNNPSASQQLIRSINLQLQSSWRKLTNIQRSVWDEYAVSHGICNKNGDKHTLSGHSLWMKYNFGYLFDHLPVITNPELYKSVRLGPELLKNTTFIPSSFWTMRAGWTYLSPGLNVSALIFSFINQGCPLITGNTYMYAVTCYNHIIGTCKIYHSNMQGILNFNQNGTFYKTFVRSSYTDTNTYIQAVTNATLKISSVSLKQVYV
jgi:hypothetical protein